MRRNDRAIEGFDNMLAILSRCEIMRLALCDGDKPYVVPLHFAVCDGEDGTAIYFHGAAEGRKIDVLTRNPNACFEADRLIRVISHETACQWAADFESIIGEGQIAIVTENTEKIRALDAIMAKYGFPGKPAYNDSALAKVCVLRLSVESMTAKTNVTA